MACYDEEKIAFITDKGLFCYRIMPLEKCRDDISKARKQGFQGTDWEEHEDLCRHAGEE